MEVNIWQMMSLKLSVQSTSGKTFVPPTPTPKDRISWLEEGTCHIFKNKNLQKENNVNLYLKCSLALPALFLLKASSAPMGPSDFGNNWLFQE